LPACCLPTIINLTTTAAFNAKLNAPFIFSLDVVLCQLFFWVIFSLSFSFFYLLLFLSKQNLYDTSIDLVSWTFEPLSSWSWYFELFQQFFILLWSWVLDTFGQLFRAASHLGID
jgi:hypothetical protein